MEIRAGNVYGPLQLLMQECIAELMKANERLRREIEVRRRVGQEQGRIIAELRMSLQDGCPECGASAVPSTRTVMHCSCSVAGPGNDQGGPS